MQPTRLIKHIGRAGVDELFQLARATQEAAARVSDAKVANDQRADERADAAQKLSDAKAQGAAEQSPGGMSSLISAAVKVLLMLEASVLMLVVCSVGGC